MTDQNSANHLVDHLFRQESGKMVSVLINIFGSEHLELAEDVVQSTLIKALENWKFNGPPENPQAWLYRVAKNEAIDIIRKERRSSQFDFSDPEHQLLTSEYTLNTTMDQFWKEDQIKDDFLGMMFACCHPDISSEAQVTFILKTLCGFSTKEVAKAFLTSEDIISKRIYRTKEHFRKNNIRPTLSSVNDIETKVSAVASAIYLIFNEGYNSTNHEKLIRQDLISQALYLSKELLSNQKTNLPEINAMMALMCFHSARTDSRTSVQGEIILLKDQDRSQWNQELIEAGQYYLAESSNGERISMYHFEAMIAFEHCLAKDFESTQWDRILHHYDQMLEIQYDPVIYLNRCLVVVQVLGPRKALQEIKKLDTNTAMEKYYLYHAALAEIFTLLKDHELAVFHCEKAIELTQSEREKNLLRRKLNALRI